MKKLIQRKQEVKAIGASFFRLYTRYFLVIGYKKERNKSGIKTNKKFIETWQVEKDDKKKALDTEPTYVKAPLSFALAERSGEFQIIE